MATVNERPRQTNNEYINERMRINLMNGAYSSLYVIFSSLWSASVVIIVIFFNERTYRDDVLNSQGSNMFSVSRMSDESAMGKASTSVLPQNIWLYHWHIITVDSQTSLNHCRTSSAGHYPCDWANLAVSPSFLQASYPIPLWALSHFCSLQLGSDSLPSLHMLC